MRLTVLGVLTGLLVCRAVHGFCEADLDWMSKAMEESAQALSMGTGRSLRVVNMMPKVGDIAPCDVGTCLSALGGRRCTIILCFV